MKAAMKSPILRLPIKCFALTPSACPRRLRSKPARIALGLFGLALTWLTCVAHIHAQNLVFNPGFESGDNGFTTDYTLWNGQQAWGAGSYFVTNSPNNVYNGWPASGDH